MRRLITTVTLTLLLTMSSVVPVFATDQQPTLQDTTVPATDETYTEWPAQKDVAVDKVWNIKFNEPVLASSVNRQNIYVLDSSGQYHYTYATVSTADSKTVQVDPTGIGHYTPGASYSLYILNGVTSDAPNSIALKSSIRMQFTVTPAHVTSASVIDGTITVTLSSPTFSDYPPTVSPTIADFSVTASGVAVAPTAISTTGAVVTLTVPTVVSTSTDQPTVYRVSYKGGDPVIANTQVTDIAPNNVKVGQYFNVVMYAYGSDGGYWWTYNTDNEAIKSIQKTTAMLYPGTGSSPELIWTFQATQKGSFIMHFSDERSFEDNSTIKTVDYTINVT